jgi:hypothetical protein
MIRRLGKWIVSVLGSKKLSFLSESLPDWDWKRMAHLAIIPSNIQKI